MDARDLIDRRKRARPDAAATFDSDADRRARSTVNMLRQARKAAGLTQAELAERAGWNQSFVSRTERLDGHLPSHQTILTWVESCGFEYRSVVIDPAAPADRTIVAEMVA